MSQGVVSMGVRVAPLIVVPTGPFGLISPSLTRRARARGPLRRATLLARHKSTKAEDAAACLGRTLARLPSGAGIVLAHPLSLRRPPFFVASPSWMRAGRRLVVPRFPRAPP